MPDSVRVLSFTLYQRMNSEVSAVDLVLRNVEAFKWQRSLSGVKFSRTSEWVFDWSFRLRMNRFYLSKCFE